MKKVIVKALCFIAIVTAPLFGQSSYSGTNDVVINGGIDAQTHNLNTCGYFYNLYGDYNPIRWVSFAGSSIRYWSAGLYGTASNTWFTQNLEHYTGKQLQAGGGGALGYFNSSFSRTFQMFTGLNLGLIYSQSKGESSQFHSQQNDLLLYVGVNFNLLKQIGESDWWPRTQVQVSLQAPLSSKISSYWNDAPISGASSWNAGYYQVLAKESIVNYLTGSSLYLSPKVLGLYSYATGNKESNYGVGGELSFHRPYLDDFASLYYIYKFSDVSKNVFILGVTINFSLINSNKK
jgi:hypothetical protein